MATEKQTAALAKARAARLANIAARKAESEVVPAVRTTTATDMRPASATRANDPMLGITKEDCCIDCTVERCVITGKAYCGHPAKCGLQANDKVNPQIMDRYNRARKTLKHAEIDRQQ